MDANHYELLRYIREYIGHERKMGTTWADIYFLLSNDMWDCMYDVEVDEITEEIHEGSEQTR